MEDLVNFFTSNFALFLKQYEKEYILYKDVSQNNEYKDTNYISEKIRGDIAKLTQVASVGNIHIYYQKKPKYYIEFLIFYIRWIEYILHCIKPAQRNVNVTVYLTKFKKMFPKSGMLTAFNVNSGVTFTYTSTIQKDVIVFREEEVFKVLMHEMIHAYNIDSIYINEEYDKPFQEYFGRSSKLRINESFTDTLACIYNVLSFSLLLGKVKGESIYPLFSKYIERERLYILEKSKDVLLYEGYMFNNNGLTKRGVQIENTHILSYYVLKAFNFYYLDHFLTFLKSQGFCLREDEKYVVNLQEYMNKKDYWSYLSRKKFQRFSSSLRMSEIDIKLLLIFAKDKLLKNIVT